MINILFHGVGTPRRELEPGEDRYWVGTDQFYRFLDELVAWPAVRISFDDGNASDLAIALPGLLERGLRADFFPLAGRVNAPGSLAEDEIRELHRHGMGVGTHGMAHRSWRGMDSATQRRELVEARQRLSALIESPIGAAALPLGQYDRRVLAELRRCDYKRVFTSDRRRARPGAWLQPRYSVRRGDTPESLRAEALGKPGMAKQTRASLAGLAKRLR